MTVYYNDFLLSSQVLKDKTKQGMENPFKPVVAEGGLPA